MAGFPSFMISWHDSSSFTKSWRRLPLDSDPGHQLTSRITVGLRRNLDEPPRQHSVDAKMVGMWGDSVILQLSNGRRVTVKLDDLRSESRIQARELARIVDSSQAGSHQQAEGSSGRRCGARTRSIAGTSRCARVRGTPAQSIFERISLLNLMKRLHLAMFWPSMTRFRRAIGKTSMTLSKRPRSEWILRPGMAWSGPFSVWVI